MLTLVKQFSNYNEEQLKGLLYSQKADDRFAASYVIGEKKVPLPRELIALLSDSSPEVQQVSRRSLILLACKATGPQKYCSQLTRQVNSLLKLGPEPTLNKQLVARASAKWNGWWDQNDPRLLKLTAAQRVAPGERDEDTQGATVQTKTSPGIVKRPPTVWTPEEAAHAKLNVAKMLARDGLLDKAKSHYEQILREYPETNAASEARQLLEKMKK